jgi:hypothetical protein
LATENYGDAGRELLSRQPSKLSAILNDGETNEKLGQDENTVGQKLLRCKEEIEMSDNDSDACTEKD